MFLRKSVGAIRVEVGISALMRVIIEIYSNADFARHDPECPAPLGGLHCNQRALHSSCNQLGSPLERTKSLQFFFHIY